MPYNRALETEADKVGLELAAKVYHINIYYCCEAYYKIIITPSFKIRNFFFSKSLFPLVKDLSSSRGNC